MSSDRAGGLSDQLSRCFCFMSSLRSDHLKPSLVVQLHSTRYMW